MSPLFPHRLIQGTLAPFLVLKEQWTLCTYPLCRARGCFLFGTFRDLLISLHDFAIPTSQPPVTCHLNRSISLILGRSCEGRSGQEDQQRRDSSGLRSLFWVVSEVSISEALRTQLQHTAGCFSTRAARQVLGYIGADLSHVKLTVWTPQAHIVVGTDTNTSKPGQPCTPETLSKHIG